jgi:2-polyprenyl-6-hydroxyphenyl methylase/3-demethylubiquinone-9 3-methyltransferase
MNIDPNEVAKFDELASRWWDKNGELKTLHEVNPLRLGYINENAPLQGKQVLDIGCGGGILTESMAKLGANVTGIDMSAAALTAAKLHLHESGLAINYLQRTAEAMATEHPGHFDIITCLEMLEHVPDPAAVITACAHLVKPGGDVFFSTLNRNLKSYLFAIIGAEYLLNLIPKNTHDFAKFIRPSELATWSRHAGLELIDMIGIHYNPLTKKYSLEKDISVNYLVHLQRAI